MQNTRTNDLVLGETMKELFEQIPEDDRGPVFRVGDVVPIKGYGYKVVRIKKNGLTFRPHGPIQNVRNEDG